MTAQLIYWGFCNDSKFTQVGLGLGLGSTFFICMIAISVGQEQTAGDPRAYTDKRAWGDTPTTWQWMTSGGLSLQHTWNQLGYIDQFGTRPGGQTIRSWMSRQVLHLDTTCPDLFASACSWPTDKLNRIRPPILSWLLHTSVNLWSWMI